MHVCPMHDIAIIVSFMHVMHTNVSIMDLLLLLTLQSVTLLYLKKYNAGPHIERSSSRIKARNVHGSHKQHYSSIFT